MEINFKQDPILKLVYKTTIRWGTIRVFALYKHWFIGDKEYAESVSTEYLINDKDRMMNIPLNYSIY